MSSDNPLRALARAVILTAIYDLCGRIPDTSYTNVKYKIQKEADHWFLRKNRWFEFWCNLAEYHPDYVYEKAMSLLKSGIPETRMVSGTSSQYHLKKNI